MSPETNQSEFDRELLSAYVDGELTDAERAEVEAELARDPALQRQMDEFRRLSGLIQEMPRPELPADFSTKVLRRARQGSSSGQVEPQRSTISIGRTFRGWVWAGAALAAALLVALLLPDPRDELARNDAARPGPAPQVESESESESRAARDPAPRVAGGEVERLAPSDAVSREELLGTPLPKEGKFSVADAPDQSSSAFTGEGDRSRLLIVRVSMPADALQGGALERVLVKNGIEVATAEAGQELHEESAAAAHALADRALSRPTDLQRQQAGAAPGGVGGGPASGPGAPAEVVLVEAPVEQITACLDTLQNDAANFSAVAIDEDSPLLREKSIAGQSTREQFWQYNRPAVQELALNARKLPAAEAPPPEAALAEVAPPHSAPAEEAASEDAAPEPSAALAAGAVQTRDAAESQRRQSAMKGRAYRYLSPSDGRERALDEAVRRQSKLEKPVEGALRYRGGESDREAGDAPLYVLFLLESEPPLLAAPVPAEAAEPPVPAAPADQPR